MMPFMQAVYDLSNTTIILQSTEYGTRKLLDMSYTPYTKIYIAPM